MKIKLDPNSWEDALWWYEDEPEIYKFMEENDLIIIEYAKHYKITVKKAIEILYKRRL